MEPAATKPRAHLLNLETEVRLEILRHLLVLERSREVTYCSPFLTDDQLTSRATQPFPHLRDEHVASVERHMRKGKPREGIVERMNASIRRAMDDDITQDTALHTAFQQVVTYQPSLQILQVCKQLRGEAEYVILKENNFIGILGGSRTVVAELKKAGIGYLLSRRFDWTNPSTFEPALQITFTDQPYEPLEMILVPTSELRQVGLAIHVARGLEHRSHLHPTGDTWDNSIYLRLAAEEHLPRAFSCQDLESVGRLVQENLLRWIGDEIRIWDHTAVDGPDRSSSLGGELATFCDPLRAMDRDQKRCRRVQWLRDTFKQTLATLADGDAVSAHQGFLKVKQHACCIIRHSRASTWVEPDPVTKICLLPILSWTLYQLAMTPAHISQLTPEWRVLFTQRALAYPAYTPQAEWTMRLNLLAAKLLGPFPALDEVRVSHLEGARGNHRQMPSQLRQAWRTLHEMRGGMCNVRDEMQEVENKTSEYVVARFGGSHVIPDHMLADAA